MKETPKFPVPCVRLIVHDSSGRILLLRRPQRAVAGGSWTLPGGKIDYGESPDTAAARELREETQFTAEHLRFLFYQDSPPLTPGGMHALNLYFTCNVEGTPTLNRESTAYEWVTLEEARQRHIEFGATEALRQYQYQ